jgi:hypothetical protein
VTSGETGPTLSLKTSCNYLPTPGFSSEDEQPVPLKTIFSPALALFLTHLNVAPPKTMMATSCIPEV